MTSQISDLKSASRVDLLCGRTAADVLPLATHHWGYESYLPLQSEIIDASLSGHDLLAILGTGQGKSLCYYLPAMSGSGLTVIISPLLALMKDQVDCLQAKNIAAARIDSTVHPREVNDILRDCMQDRLRLLYVSPERCMDPTFITFLRRCKLTRFVIDEVHCITEWGRDFRKNYGQLGGLRTIFPRVPIAGFTATAAPSSRGEICESLHLRDPQVFVGDFFRPNLNLRVIEKDFDPYGQIATLLNKLLDLPHSPEYVLDVPPCQGDGIIYCNTQRATEELAACLREMGFNSQHFHADLDDALKHRIQDWFLSPSPGEGNSKIIIATIAFGMGINKPDVRFVIHYGMPSSLEVYHQEIGRAGRDGQPAECVMLWSYDDWNNWIEIFESQGDDDAALKRRGDSLQNVMNFTENPHTCRHLWLCEYFGQKWTRGNCDACDMCLAETS